VGVEERALSEKIGSSKGMWASAIPTFRIKKKTKVALARLYEREDLKRRRKKKKGLSFASSEVLVIGNSKQRGK